METEYVSMFYQTALALLPPIVAIALALITKEAFSSLFIGIIVGALLYSNFQPIMALDTVVNEGFIKSLADPWNIGIFMFLVLLGIMVCLINKAGGSRAFGAWAKEHVKTRAGATLATFALGVLIFVDDYFNCLTVGSVMRPVTDSHKISRSKLAYIIDATAAPVCMIAPISSWAAAVSGMVDESEFSGIELFIRAIPYNFYSILTFVFIICLAKMNFDYGPMALHEKNAIENNDLFTSGSEDIPKEDDDKEINPNGKVIDLVFPIVILILFCVVGMIYVGGFFSGSSFLQSFSDTDASLGLPWGALVALIITIIYFICRRILTFKEAMGQITKGFIAMVPAILILSFAVTLKTVTNMLGADVFVANLMQSASGVLYAFLPPVIFIVGCFLAFATGTSWGTFGILIPIVTALFPHDSELLIIGISACLAGAVCGDHCSPISDTTIMASAGAQCNHLNHVQTQLPYVIVVAVVSGICFLLTSLLYFVMPKNTWFVSLPVSIIIMIIVMFVIKNVTTKKA